VTPPADDAPARIRESWERNGPRSWQRLLADTGFATCEAQPVHHPGSGASLSIILAATGRTRP